MPRLINFYLILLMLIVPLTSAALSYNNPNLPIIERTAPTGNYNITNNINGTSYNATYDKWAYNQTLGGDNRFVNIDGDNWTGNMNAGSNNLTNVGYIKYNLSICSTTDVIDTTKEGDTCWNPDKHAINYVTGLGNIIQISQEQWEPVRNKAGQIVYAGQILSLNGTTGEIEDYILASVNASNPQLHNIGMVTIPSCNNNALCPITTLGDVHDLDTSAFAEGTNLYLSCDNSGNVTNVKQTSPNCFNRYIGEVSRSHATTGIIHFAPEIDETDGVIIHELDVLTNLSVFGNVNVSENLFVSQNATIFNKLKVGEWLANTLGLTLTDDGSNLVLLADVGGINGFFIETNGAFLELFANPGPANDYEMFSIQETQGDDTQILFYEGGVGNNRFWDSGSARFGGSKSSKCSNLTTDVDCDTSGSGADIVVQDDGWFGGKLFASDWSNVSISVSQVTGLINSIWQNISGVATYEGNVNITGNLTIGSRGKVLTNTTSIFYYNGTKYFDLTKGSGGGTPNQISSFNQATCPTGWILADGTSGTPDLRGIFIRGAGTSGVVKYANNSLGYVSATFGEYGNDSFQGHSFADKTDPTKVMQTTYTNQISTPVGDPAGSTIDFYNGVASGGKPVFASNGVSGTPRVGNETTPAYYTLIYCMKTTEDTVESTSIFQTIGDIISTVNITKIIRFNTQVNVTNLTVEGSFNLLPRGAIMPYYLASCPTGWILADGTGGTPDLRGVFIRGAGTSGVVKYANGSFMSSAYGQYKNDSFQDFRFQVDVRSTAPFTQGSVAVMGASAGADFGITGSAWNPTTGGAGAPRFGNETAPASFSLIYCMKS